MDWVRTEVDGVPAFWCEHPGELRAGLVFRVGHADERLSQRGVTHLVEHLACHPAGQSMDHANGMVNAVMTTFYTAGDPAAVNGFFGDVCRSLRELPLDRLAAECRILSIEADGRTPGPASALLLWRYGAATYGLAGYEEYGAGRLTGEQLQEWAQHWFTAGNAALWLVGGPPPAGLRLDLPNGPRTPPPAPSSALEQTPAYFTSNLNGVAASTVLDRSAAASAYSQLLLRRLRQALRFDTAVSYSPGVSYEPRDGQQAHLTAFADGLPASYGALVAGFVSEFDRLADEPPAAEEVTAIRRRHSGRPELDLLAVMTATSAESELMGGRPIQPREWAADVQSLTPQALHAVAVQARDAALLMLPADQQPPGGRYRRELGTSPGTVEGRTLLGRGRRNDAPRTLGPPDRDRLVIGDTGVSHVHGPRFRTVLFADCQAMLAWPDGRRQLIGSDGVSVLVEPAVWKGGQFLPAFLDAAVDPAAVVRLAGDPPAPAAHASGWLRRRRSSRP